MDNKTYNNGFHGTYIRYYYILVREEQCSVVQDEECALVNEQECSTSYEQECQTINQEQCNVIQVMKYFQWAECDFGNHMWYHMLHENSN